MLTADDKILNNSIPEAKAMRNKFDQYLQEHYSKEKFRELLSIMLMSRKAHLVDPGFIKLVRDANKKTQGVMCVTTCGVGCFGKMKSWEDWRISELRNFGLTFTSQTFPDVSAKQLIPYLKERRHSLQPSLQRWNFVCL